MINNSEFSKRLRTLIEFYQLSASSFADKIGVQRSSISHLLSGRNKPSLDFVLKTVKEFEEVELYWLLNGKGSFPHVEASPIATSTKKSNLDINVPEGVKNSGKIEITSVDQKTIERIVLFYKDGTFKEYLK